MVLTLFYGIASEESGFSVNEELLIENIEEETKDCFDAIRLADIDITKINIS